MEQDTKQILGRAILRSQEMMKRGYNLDPGQQVSTEDGSGADPDLEEGVVMTETIENREKRLPTPVRSSN